MILLAWVSFADDTDETDGIAAARSIEERMTLEDYRAYWSSAAFEKSCSATSIAPETDQPTLAQEESK